MDKFFQTLTLGHLFRYGFSGFVLLLCAAFVTSVEATNVRTVLGDVLTVVTAFVLGAAIYAAYRAVCDAPIYWIHFWLHLGWKALFRGHVCKLHENLEVPAAERQHAYRCIRDWPGHTESIRAQLSRYELEHSEIHTLYLFAFVVAVFSLWAWFVGRIQGSNLAWAEGLAFAAGALAMIRDIGLCRRETSFMLMAIAEDERKTILKKAGALLNEHAALGPDPH